MYTYIALHSDACEEVQSLQQLVCDLEISSSENVWYQFG